MSDTGLFSSQYQQIHEWAEMIDSLLIDLKTGSSPSNPSFKQNLGQLLLDLAQGNYGNPATRFMVIHFQDRADLPKNQLKKTGKALLAGQLNEEVINFIEQFAQILEQEQIGVMARMGRWTR